MVEYPAYVNGEPPVISLMDYDNAEWAKDTAVDYNKEQKAYLIVLMNDPSKVIAKFDQVSEILLQDIYKSAQQQYQEGNIQQKD